MIARWLPRTLFTLVFGLLLALAPVSRPLLAGDGGTVPPIPTCSQNSSSWSDLCEVGLYALTLIY
jgi:hypothetical protein